MNDNSIKYCKFCGAILRKTGEKTWLCERPQCGKTYGAPRSIREGSIFDT